MEFPPELRRFADAGLHVMAKPIGPICNLDCEYCYYLHKEDLYPGTTSWRMPAETLETYIRQYIEAQPAPAPEITFAWQGGEPTLLGVDFFRRVVEIQQHYAPPGKTVVNTLQTNGVLIDDEWCEFFKEHGFLIGLSIDGPPELHDRYRYDKKSRPTFRAVLDCLKRFKKHHVDFNALVVVNSHNGNHGRRVYTYLRDNGVQFLQFIPIVERQGIGAHADGEREHDLPIVDLTSPVDPGRSGDVAAPPEELVSSRSVGPEQFGDFLIEVFDEWIRRDVGKVFVQIFDQALSAWLGMEPSLCVFRKQCGRALAIEHNGDLYSCDHYVEPAYKLGNIHELPIVELANSERQMQFGRDKEATLPQYCLDCEVRFACNGECPKNRFLSTPDGEPGLNYLCAGYRKFFNHIDPYMMLMAEELRHERPAANVMHRLNARRKAGTGKSSGSPREGVGLAEEDRTAAVAQSDAAHRSAAGLQRAERQTPPGRNDPCPCGSGRKYKKCCLR